MTSRQATSDYMRIAGPAVRRVRYAVKTGRLLRQPCEECGAAEVQAHHPRGYDSAHALDVQWLCRPHHMARHGRRRSRPSWDLPGQVRAYVDATRPRYGKTYSFDEASGPKRLLTIIEIVWRLFRTDEERAYALALVNRLAQGQQEDVA